VCECCDGLESARHLFLSCPVIAPLGTSIRSWIGISSADPNLLQNHFVQFINSSEGFRARRSFLQLVLLCCISYICNERNGRIFKAKETIISHIVDKVKLNSLWWLKSYNVNLV
jgi:hypothetical protein